MPQTILVLLRRPDEAEPLLGVGASLAANMGGARINALAVRETVQTALVGAAALVGRAEALLMARDDERRRVAVLHASFDDWSAAAGQYARDAHWFEAEGDTTDIVAEWGRRADVIVTGRPHPEDRLGRQAFRVALLGTDRPILMVPPRATAAGAAAFGRCIAIAWRDEKQSLRVVLPALRCLKGAEQLHVLMGVRNGRQRPSLPSVFAEHGLTARLHVLAAGPEPFGQMLLETVHRLSADLLIMGAYAHSPLGELILGGVTRHVLDHGDMPVLMRH